MAHPEQQHFCLSVKKRYPRFFKHVNVLDIGSLDINGNNRYLFEDYKYIGVDMGEGKNVDVVSKCHLYDSPISFDVVISTECFEHDPHWRETIANCTRLLAEGGLFIFSCATTGRQEHGTKRTTPQDAPLSHDMFGDYYMNLTNEDILSIENFADLWDISEFSNNKNTKDLYFFGIKK